MPAGAGDRPNLCIFGYQLDVSSSGCISEAVEGDNARERQGLNEYDVDMMTMRKRHYEKR